MLENYAGFFFLRAFLVSYTVPVIIRVLSVFYVIKKVQVTVTE